jgi:hypothetical protein
VERIPDNPALMHCPWSRAGRESKPWTPTHQASSLGLPYLGPGLLGYWLYGHGHLKPGTVVWAWWGWQVSRTLLGGAGQDLLTGDLQG